MHHFIYSSSWEWTFFCPPVYLTDGHSVSSFFLQQVQRLSHSLEPRKCLLLSAFRLCFPFLYHDLAVLGFSSQTKKRRSWGESSKGEPWETGVTSHMQRETKGVVGPFSALGMGVDRRPQSLLKETALRWGEQGNIGLHHTLVLGTCSHLWRSSSSTSWRSSQANPV